MSKLLNIRCFYISVLFLLSLTFYSQPLKWAKSLGGTNDEVAYSVSLDLSGNVYTIGWFQGTVDFDPGPGVYTLTTLSGVDAYVSKLDANGNFVWAKKIAENITGTWGQGIKIDGLGNVYSTGFFGSPADFDPGPGTFTIAGNGGSDSYLSKLDMNGNFVWAFNIGGKGSDLGMATDVDPAGNVFVAGRFADTTDFDPGPGTFIMIPESNLDTYIAKFDANSNFIWARQFNDPNALFNMDVDANGNVYTTGIFIDSTDFDPGPGVYKLYSKPGSFDAFVSKLDPNGNFVLAKVLATGPFDEVAWSIKTDKSGNIYTTGSVNGAGADFDPGPATYTLPYSGNADIFISKLDPAGNLLWATTKGGGSADVSYALALDANNNVYTTGSFVSAVDFDPGPATYTLPVMTSSVGSMYVCKLDSNGNFVWAKCLSGTSGGNGWAVETHTNGDIYVAGEFWGTTDFDYPYGANITVAGARDVFVCKLGSCSVAPLPSVISGSTSICKGVNQNYTAAPVTGATSYSWNLPSGWSGTSTTNSISTISGSSGSMSVSTTNTCGTSLPKTLSVTVLASPTINVNSGSVCAGKSFTMYPSGANTYTFSSGSAIVSPTTTTSYSITGVSLQGCIGSNTAVSTVTVNPLPTITVTPSPNIICVGQYATMTASGASSYTWSTGGVFPTEYAYPTSNTTYTVIGKDANGCINSATFTQSVSACTGINNLVSENNLLVYPNPFNTKITIAYKGQKQNLQIYNSVGSLIHSIDIENEKVEIDLTKYSSGIYFIRVDYYYLKLVKE